MTEHRLPRLSRSPSRLGTVRVVALLAALLVPMAAHAVDRSSDEQREMLVGLLGDTRLRLERSALDTVGDDVPRQLLLIADLPRMAPIVRVRAVAALAYYPNSDTHRYLQGLLLERSLIGRALGTKLRRQALRSLAVAFGGVAVDDILSLRRDVEPLIRQSVASALGDAGDRRALAVLEDWLGSEPDITVRTAIDNAITQLRGR